MTVQWSYNDGVLPSCWWTRYRHSSQAASMSALMMPEVLFSEINFQVANLKYFCLKTKNLHIDLITIDRWTSSENKSIVFHKTSTLEINCIVVYCCIIHYITALNYVWSRWPSYTFWYVTLYNESPYHTITHISRVNITEKTRVSFV